MRNYIILVAFSCLLFCCKGTKTVTSGSSADDLLMTVGSIPVTIGEFEYAYLKNNHLDTTNKNTRKDIEEYLELYKNFKLKVVEAQTLGRDTLPLFLSEFETYERQLAEPYLAMSKLSEANVRQAYERSKEEVAASHILIKLPENPTPEDTLESFNRAIEARNRILNGETFEKVAKEVSEDPSAANNAGYLGYFTAMQMVLPFEIATYATAVGEVSPPVRTSFGYHIIYVKDRIPTRDQIKVAHIMLTNKDGQDSSKIISKINGIYEELKQGESWETLCQSFSDDEYSKNNGGELPFIRPGRIDPDFEKVAFALETVGSFSEPFKTKYGWHIVKLIDRKESNESFEDMKPQIEQNLSRYGSYLNQEKSAVELLKKENSYVAYKDALKECYANIQKPDSTYSKDKTIFSFDNTDFSCESFNDFLVESQPFHQWSQDELNEQYTFFENEKILAYERDVLLKKNLAYRYLRQEYRDGILLFSIMEDSVWNKASADTAGLRVYYENNKEEYPKKESINTIHITTKEENDLKMFLKIAQQEGEDSLFILEEKYNEDDPLSVTVSVEVIEKGKNKYADAQWSVGTLTYKENDRYHGLIIRDINPAGYKALDDIKGKVISNYQNHIEKLWVAELREKHEIKINEDKFDVLVNKIGNEQK